MSFLGNIFHAKHAARSIGVGVDIGTTSIKLVELQRMGETITLTNYAFLELSERGNALNNALQSSSLHPLAEDLGNFLLLLRRKMQPHEKRVTFALPTFIAQTALLDIPQPGQSAKSLTQAVMQTAGSYLPLPLAETTIQWSEIGETTGADGTRQKKILFMAIPTERIDGYRSIVARAGFTPEEGELESISVARALTYKRDEPTLIIDIGGRSSTCTVAKQGKAYAVSQTDFSSDSATQAVAQALSISPKRAESLKRQSAVRLDAGNHELSTIITPIIGAILTEADRVKKIFEEATGEQLKKVLLCGAGSQLSGLEPYVSARLNLPAAHASAIGETIMYPPELHAIVPELNAHLTVAIGLALKNLIV